MRNKLVFNKKANKEEWKRCEHQVHITQLLPSFCYLFISLRNFSSSFLVFLLYVGYSFSLFAQIWIEHWKKCNTRCGRFAHRQKNTKAIITLIMYNTIQYNTLFIHWSCRHSNACLHKDALGPRSKRHTEPYRRLSIHRMRK